MKHYSESIIALAAGAALVAAKTPSGFTPASTTDLIVTFGKTEAMNGVVVDKALTQTEPTIATSSQLTGSSYAVIMLDLDIPSNTNPHVLLHWMQTDLTPATSASSLTTANGTSQAFVLENAKNTSALAEYLGPAPPAKTPLSHRYTQILIDTSSMKSNATAALKAAAAQRMGFDITTVLKSAGLSNNVVAGNSFNVTNAGPADDSGTATGSGTGTGAASGSGSGSGTGSASNSTTTRGSGGGGSSGASTRGSNSTTKGTATATAKGSATATAKGTATATAKGSTASASGKSTASATGKSSASATSSGARASGTTVTTNSAYSLAPSSVFALIGLAMFAFCL